MTYPKNKIVVLISNTGTGTNLQAIMEGVDAGAINAEILAVVSDKEDAPALERARGYNINIRICKKKEDLLPLFRELSPDFICLAGWKQIILDEVILAYPNKILNLHPGIIPDTLGGIIRNPDGTKAIWNKSLLARAAIQNFLDEKATYAGASIHFLTLDFDFGPVLGRVFEKIEPNDDVTSLYGRLKTKENKLYIDVLNKLTHGKQE